MTALYNDVITIKNAGTSGSDALDAKWNGRVRIQAGTYEAAGASIADTIKIAEVPVGCYILPSSTVSFDALGASTTLAVGNPGTPALYSAATSTSSAGTLNLTAIAGINAAVVATTSGTDIILTVAGGAITGTIQSVIEYAFI
jgi:hypothetical protein